VFEGLLLTHYSTGLLVMNSLFLLFLRNFFTFIFESYF